MAKFKKGNNANPNGRPKGSKDKFTDLKKAFLEAFEKLGGVNGLVNFAKANSLNKRTFYQMIARMLPSNVTIDPDSELTIRIIEKIVNENGGNIANGDE